MERHEVTAKIEELIDSPVEMEQARPEFIEVIAAPPGANGEPRGEYRVVSQFKVIRHLLKEVADLQDRVAVLEQTKG